MRLTRSEYMRNYTDAGKRVGQIYGETGASGNHIGLTSSRTETSYLFDLPYAVNTAGYLVDVPGGISRSVDLETGGASYEAFILSGYSASAYESYIWQETARMDAVSSVRGIQFANDEGIEVLTLTKANIAAEKLKLTSNANADLDYSTTTVDSISNLVNQGYEVTMPRSLIVYGNWTGQVYIGTRNKNGRMTATFAIGPYAGGWTAGWSNSIFVKPISQGSGSNNYSFNYQKPQIYRNKFTPPDSGQPSIPSSNILAPKSLNSIITLGGDPSIVTAGDPVNMVTGNMYLTERDIAIKGRGLPIVFERTYNRACSKNITN